MNRATGLKKQKKHFVCQNKQFFCVVSIVQSRLKAEWASRAIGLLDTKGEPWKHMWWEELQATYGDLATPELLQGTCAFKKFGENKKASEMQRRALSALGELQPPQGERKEKEEDGEGKKRVTGEGKKGRKKRKTREKTYLEEAEGFGGIGVQWTREEVLGQRLFFNVWYKSNTRLTGRSTDEVEQAAIDWAGSGVITVKDVIDTGGGRLLKPVEFKAKHANLDRRVYAELLREIPQEWKQALTRAGVAEREPPMTRYLSGVARTLSDRPAVEIRRLGVKELYTRFVAERWKMPKCFEPGKDGDKVWGQKERAIEDRDKDLKRIFEAIRHPAVPRWMTDRSYKVATDSEFIGRRFHQKHPERMKCPRCGKEDSVAHKYGRCREIREVWKLFLRAWKKATGEDISEEDEWVTRWGARWVNWKSDEDKRNWGGEALQEVFKVLHTAMLSAIHEAHGRREVGRSAREWKAHQIYQRAQVLAGQVVNDRSRGKEDSEKFVATWLDTGMAKIVGSKKGVVLTIWSLKGRPQGVKRSMINKTPKSLCTPAESPPGGPGSPGYSPITLSTSRKLSPTARTCSTTSSTSTW